MWCALQCDHAWISGHCLHQLVCLSPVANYSRSRCFLQTKAHGRTLAFSGSIAFFLLARSFSLTYALSHTHSLIFSSSLSLVTQQKNLSPQGLDSSHYLLNSPMLRICMFYSQRAIFLFFSTYRVFIREDF